MKTYKILRSNMKLSKDLHAFLERHQKWSKSFKWSPRGNASQRRNNEFYYEYEFKLKENVYKFYQDLEISSKRFYYSSSIYVNDEKKDIRIVKNLLKKRGAK